MELINTRLKSGAVIQWFYDNTLGPWMILPVGARSSFLELSRSIYNLFQAIYGMQLPQNGGENEPDIMR